MSLRELPSVPMKGLPGAGPLSRSKIEPYVFGRRYESEKQKHPFDPRFLRMTNPYTQQTIKSEADYYEYLREHTYLMLCDELVVKQTQEIRETAQNEITWLQNQNAYLIQSSSDTDGKLRRSRRLCFLLAIALIISIFVCVLIKNIAYNKGVSECQTRSYASGLVDQKSADSNQIDKSYYSGISRDVPIALSYIGNKKTKKFHKSTCSYLPDKSNQITFDSREEAIAAGYDPCGHCHP